MRLVTRAILALALVGAVAACGGSTPTATTTTGATTATATLNASEFAFDQTALEVASGARLTLTLANKGTIEHDFTIDSLNIKLYAPVGQSPSVTTDALAAGTYDFYCSIAGHKEAGMTGTLTVK